MKSIIVKFLIVFICTILLTIITQVGGVLLILTLLIYKAVKRGKFKWKRAGGVFIFIYLLFTVIVIPLVAPFIGRVALPITGSSNIVPATIITCLLNRHYVKPALKEEMEAVANKFEASYPSIKILYLDANFPFFNGFPMLPHLSHNDGNKIDLALFYNLSNGEPLVNQTPTFLGYGYFISPKDGQIDYNVICKNKGYWQYDFIRYFTFRNEGKFVLNEEKTRYLLKALSNQAGINKILFEPHLKERLGFSKDLKIRFQGCHAVRHDDHIHVQL